MAEFKGINHTLAYVDEPSTKLKAKDDHGAVRSIYDSYLLSAELSLNDTILMMKLPKGAKVVDARLVAPSDGTTGQYSVGWQSNGTDAADADGFFIGSSAGDTGGGAVDSKLLATRPGWNMEFAEETQVELLLAEATTASDGDTIELMISYIVN